MTDVCARKGSGAGTGLRYLLWGLGLLLALLTASCGNSIFTPGTPVITLTAKPGRFTSYVVRLYQIYFTRSDGNISYIPAVSQLVDLAHLPENEQIFTLSPIEVGTYVSATFVLDYSTPYITVDTGNGQSTLALPIDPSNSGAAGTITVTVKFDPAHQLVINNQNSTPLALDIDLEASNIIGYASDGKTLQTTVKPFWTATTVPSYNKPVYARGLYVIADEKNNNFTMNVRPLHDILNSPMGALTVNVGAQTYYQINGATYVGSNGLAALARLQNIYANIQIAAVGAPSATPFGNLSTIQPSMTATEVYVGSSLESTIEDEISGFVSAVNGNVLTVQEATYVDHFGYFGFAQSVPVTIGPNTIISEDGNPNFTPGTSSISVGQFITALGTGSLGTGSYTAYATGVDLPVSFDATGTGISGAQVRLQNSTFYGTVNSLNTPATGSMSVNMQYIDNVEPTQIKFAGTGASGADATASAYIVNTGSLDTTALNPGDLLRVDGMPTAFGSGPPYFTASAITPASQLDAQLILQWSGTGSSSPFSSVSSTGITVNLADAALQPAGSTAAVRVGPIIKIPNLVTAPPGQLTIAFNTTNAAEPPLFGVGSVAAGESLYSDPAAFAAQVQSVVNSTNPALKLVATGQYNASTGTFTATSVSINVK
jgi:hypothetical protein